jgi:hypothetical protein
MSKTATLRDAYRHPGFVPQVGIRVDERDSDIFVLPLHRRRKKTPVGVADESCLAITTTSYAEAAISTAVGEKSSSNSSSAGSIVPGAV